MATLEGESLGAFYALEDMIMAYTKSFIVKAVVELEIPDTLAKAGGQLSLKELAEKLSGKALSIDYLGRVMTYAAVNGLFTQTAGSRDGTVADEKKEFGLTALSKLLVEKESDDPRLSIAHTARFLIHPTLISGSNQLSGAVRTGNVPFGLGNEKSFWEMWQEDPEWNVLANKAMAVGSLRIMGTLVKVYKGFDGIKQLVDVGGGIGASLTVITQAHPHIQGINYDRPHVIATAPEIPGVKHVGGDMFKSVPEADGIFLKWVMHDWGNEECHQILKNCAKSLPADGKLIIVDRVLPDPAKGRSAFDYTHDIRVLTDTTGRERTAGEWRRLLQRSGFQRVELFPDLGIVEGYKS